MTSRPPRLLHEELQIVLLTFYLKHFVITQLRPSENDRPLMCLKSEVAHFEDEGGLRSKNVLSKMILEFSKD